MFLLSIPLCTTIRMWKSPSIISNTFVRYLFSNHVYTALISQISSVRAMAILDSR